MQTGEWLFIDTAQLSQKIRFYKAEKEGIKHPETMAISGCWLGLSEPRRGKAAYCCWED